MNVLITHKNKNFKRVQPAQQINLSGLGSNPANLIIWINFPVSLQHASGLIATAKEQLKEF